MSVSSRLILHRKQQKNKASAEKSAETSERNRFSCAVRVVWCDMDISCSLKKSVGTKCLSDLCDFFSHNVQFVLFTIESVTIRDVLITDLQTLVEVNRMSLSIISTFSKNFPLVDFTLYRKVINYKS